MWGCERTIFDRSCAYLLGKPLTSGQGKDIPFVWGVFCFGSLGEGEKGIRGDWQLEAARRLPNGVVSLTRSG